MGDRNLSVSRIEVMISWNNNHYFNLKLLDFDREEVVIRIIIHNAESVQVRTKDGEFYLRGNLER